MTGALIGGRRGEVVHVDTAAGLGPTTVSVLDPVADLDHLHEWVTRPSSRFWGLGELPREELSELFAHVDSLDTHHAFLLRRQGLPVALLQTYDPAADPLGECYPVLAGDVGFHFLLAERGPRIDAYTTRIAAVMSDFILSHPDARRIVTEPDAENLRAVDRVAALGFELHGRIRLPHKTAMLCSLTRTAWREGAARARTRAPRPASAGMPA
jgi:RimJ/RimL family protein N-acetyltransferase